MGQHGLYLAEIIGPQFGPMPTLICKKFGPINNCIHKLNLAQKLMFKLLLNYSKITVLHKLCSRNF